MVLPLVEGIMEYIVLMALKEIFERNATSMTLMWLEKNLCAEDLKALLEAVETLDANLVQYRREMDCML